MGGHHIMSTTFGGDLIVLLLLCSNTHYDITMGHGVTRGTHNDVTVSSVTHITWCYNPQWYWKLNYVLLCPILILLFLE